MLVFAKQRLLETSMTWRCPEFTFNGERQNLCVGSDAGSWSFAMTVGYVAELENQALVSAEIDFDDQLAMYDLAKFGRAVGPCHRCTVTIEWPDDHVVQAPGFPRFEAAGRRRHRVHFERLESLDAAVAKLGLYLARLREANGLFDAVERPPARGPQQDQCYVLTITPLLGQESGTEDLGARYRR
jgi:hypothetical protein